MDPDIMSDTDWELQRIANVMEAQNKELKRIAVALEKIQEKGISTWTTIGEL